MVQIHPHDFQKSRNFKHPFLLIRNYCRYLHSEALRREVQEGLNVIENWNGANNLILYGKGGEIGSNDFENQEITMLALHLLQISLVYINTLMIQRILGEPNWTQRMTPEDLRASRRTLAWGAGWETVVSMPKSFNNVKKFANWNRSISLGSVPAIFPNVRHMISNPRMSAECSI
jgi:hypothetical protein